MNFLIVIIQETRRKRL